MKKKNYYNEKRIKSGKFSLEKCNSWKIWKRKLFKWIYWFNIFDSKYYENEKQKMIEVLEIAKTTKVITYIIIFQIYTLKNQ